MNLKPPKWLEKAFKKNSEKPLDSADVITSMTSWILIAMLLLLMMQVIGLHAFISSLSTPQCSGDGDCPITTFCSDSIETKFITGFDMACESCSPIWGLSSYQEQKYSALRDNSTNCGGDYYSNDNGMSFENIIGITLVAFTVGKYW